MQNGYNVSAMSRQDTKKQVLGCHTSAVSHPLLINSETHRLNEEAV